MTVVSLVVNLVVNLVLSILSATPPLLVVDLVVDLAEALAMEAWTRSPTLPLLEVLQTLWLLPKVVRCTGPRMPLV